MLKRISIIALALLLVPTLVGAAESKFVSGDLGTVDLGAKALSGTVLSSMLQGILAAELDGEGDEEMVMTRMRTDRVGNTHIRFHQKFNGLNVVGGDMYMHANAVGQVYAVNGSFAHGSDLPLAPALTADVALNKALPRAKLGHHEVLDTPELTYVIAEDDTYLAYAVTVDYVNADGPQRDIVFADAMTGRVVARHPQFHYARSLETHDCNNGTSNSACNNLVSNSSNTINTGDAAIDAAHNYAIATYDYYFNNHGRDSYNGNGGTLKSRVHYSSNYNNAFWDGVQMTYGDGDGVTFIPLSQDADVVAHELTHGVTSSESNLIYANESGALNEALSDIFGAMVDRQEGATGADIWLLGEGIYTPGIPGDGLRDMSYPSSLGDFDYYPTRYTGSQDNGGVHWNSGIANLAFVLMVEGGTHPAGVTSNNVPAIGFDKAADIFYYANTSCLVSSSNFEAARDCTAAGALSLFGATEEAAVHEAWDAVGVPGGPGGGPTCGAAGTSCNRNNDCCSNRCRGRRGNKTCR